jgi:hypothetical protein
MLSGVSAAVLCQDDDADDRWAAQDYAWMLQLKAIVHTTSGWMAFRAGYAAGGEIGERYARRQLRLVGADQA